MVEILINPPGEPREHHLVEVRHKIKYQIISVIYESIILIFLMNCPTIYKFWRILEKSARKLKIKSQEWKNIVLINQSS